MDCPLSSSVGVPRSARRSAVTPSAIALATLLLAGCAVGPDYVQPTLNMPVAFKEVGAWKTAVPQPIDAGQPWWEVYRDVTLNALMLQANAANQNIRQAEAQYRAAQAITAAASANFFPAIGLNAGVARAQTDSNNVVKRATGGTLGLNASWEPDLWGAVRRSVEAGTASAAASADDLAGARLSIQTTLAQDYLQVRVLDLQRDLYRRTTTAYGRATELTQHQYAAGVALRSDVALAQSQLNTAQAQAVDLEATRSQLEHAIAVLTGQAPASYTLAALPAAAQMSAAALSSTAALQMQLPVTPVGVPSELLERRPDIAAAERRVQAANANIGVATAAYFPRIMLGAAGGFSPASMLGAFFDTPSRVWSLGATLAQTVFDGGLRQAHTDQAIAAYDVSVAQYKQTVLGGFQQVEDNLAILRVLDTESGLQAQAVQAAELAERLALSQYQAGTSSYLSVVTAQTLSLTNQRTAAQLLGRQLASSVALIAAMGGGWTAVKTTDGI